MSRCLIDIIVNPAAGSGLAGSLVASHIEPLIIEALEGSADSVRLHETRSLGDGVRIGNEIYQLHVDSATGTSSSSCDSINVVIVGGDGTTHEFLNGFYLGDPQHSEQTQGHRKVEGKRLNLAIVPAGTANALYASLYPSNWTQETQQHAASAKTISQLSAQSLEVMLRSVRALIASLPSPTPTDERGGKDGVRNLPLILNQLYVDGKQGKVSLSHIVTSHALHASILHDADTAEMRAQHEGIERFKVAAQQNATTWIDGSLTLYPYVEIGREVVQRYSPASKSFEDVKKKDEEDGEEGKVEIEGPFLYLTAMVSDRLESAFVPAPLSSTAALPEGAIDLVVIRPTRDPAIAALGDKVREEGGLAFAMSRLGPITAGMYDGGKHIDLTYPSKEGGDEGGAEPMVEYFRCSGYQFVPRPEGRQGEDKARLVCTDGYISHADQVRVSRWLNSDPPSQRGRGLRSDVEAPLLWH